MQETSKAKGVSSSLIDRTQSNRTGKREIKAAKREANKKRSRMKYPLRDPRKDVKILG
jgi:hypothetical protein